MPDDVPHSTLDLLAAELVTKVRRAATAQADTALAAQFDGMRLEVDAASTEIAEYAAVSTSPHLRVSAEHRQSLESRTAWVEAQIARVRTILAEDPRAVRQGKVWRETKQAIEALRKDLVLARDAGYAALLEEFVAGDRQLLETVPPGIAGLREYRAAVETFESTADRRPRSIDDVAQAAAAGRRLRDLRERVERDAVPSEFQDEWRVLRAGGLSLTALTDDFRAWLDSHGLSQAIVLTYRAA